jgi:hypothetical protein
MASLPFVAKSRNATHARVAPLINCRGEPVSFIVRRVFRDPKLLPTARLQIAMVLYCVRRRGRSSSVLLNDREI